MLGEHHKTRLWRDNVEIEISWDVLTLVQSGRVISEIEIELRQGDKSVLNQCAKRIEEDLGLPCIHASKYQQGIRLDASATRAEA